MPMRRLCLMRGLVPIRAHCSSAGKRGAARVQTLQGRETRSMQAKDLVQGRGKGVGVVRRLLRTLLRSASRRRCYVCAVRRKITAGAGLEVRIASDGWRRMLVARRLVT